MDQLRNFLDYPIPTVSDQSIAVWKILASGILILIGFLLIRLIERILVNRMKSKNINPNLIQLIQRIYIITVLAILVFTTLQLLNVPMAAFAFISGAVAIGVGFGAQNIINNFISGWILMWERPIRIGDFLEINETKGLVEAINTRSTRIRRVDGVHLLIPNSYLLENIVVNWTLVDNIVRTQVQVGVAYGSPVRQVSDLIMEAIESHKNILKEPAPVVFFESFGDNSLIFDAFFWVTAFGEKDLRAIRSDIRFAIDELFRENEITIAFPQRDIHISNSEPVEVRMVEDKLSASQLKNDE